MKIVIQEVNTLDLSNKVPTMQDYRTQSFGFRFNVGFGNMCFTCEGGGHQVARL